jgi:heavy metal sensor kinase
MKVGIFFASCARKKIPTFMERISKEYVLKVSLGTRLALSYLAVILVGMGIIAPLAWWAVENLYLNTQSASLIAQAQLVAAALRSEAPANAQPLPYSQMSNTLPGIHTRIIDAEGAVVIDLALPAQLSATSLVSLPQLAQNASGLVTADELFNRPEIAQARSGQAATAIRRIEAAGGQRVLYAAAPVIAAGGEVLQIVYLATPLPDTQLSALPEPVRWQFGIALVAAILLATATGLLLARRITRPLEKLISAAHAVAGGDLGQSVPEDPAIAELAVLGRAFNRMTTSLRQSDQAKTAFISDVNHELRTPLTVLKGTIETLQDGALDDLNARGPFLESMSRETERLIRLVNDLLILTRADAGALNLQLRPVDLAELARSRCEHFALAATQRQVGLRVESGSQSYMAMADPDRIAQVLDNLLDNALRYAPPTSQVTVTLAREAGQAVCRVSDQGPGIPAKHLPLIFERFYRVDPARGRAQGGSGLGLSIVRGLVLAHGGRVSASSVEGEGTTLTFWLPLTS